MKWIGRFVGALMPAALAGAFFTLTLFRVQEPGDSNRVGLLLLGGIYGIGVVGLIRLFRVAPWCFPFVGLLCGPLPAALLVREQMSSDDRAGLWFMTAMLGFLVGLIEWGRVSRARREAAAGEKDRE